MLERTPVRQRSTLASLVLVRVYTEISIPNEEFPWHKPKGYVFVRNEKEFGTNALYRLISGHGKRGERALPAAMRELREETNLQPDKKAFHYLGRWLDQRDHGNHWKYLFAVDIDEKELCWMRSTPEGEGEEPRLFKSEEFYALVRADKFMREHYDKLVEHSLILPFGRDKPGRDS